MKKYIFIIFLAFGFSTFAQDASDVLRLSQYYNHGTARFVSMGGAFGALGADFTSLSYNPAGLGVYRSSEITFTPSLKTRLVDTRYLNTPFSDSRTRVLLDNIGFVTSLKTIKEEETGLVMINLGIGYNRINDFYSETTAIGANASNSIMDLFAGNASGFYWDNLTIREGNDPFESTNAPWETILAWNNFLIDTVPGYDTSYWAALNNGDGVNQDQTISSVGGIGEYTFSIGANVSNKFYFGATIGLQDVYFKQTIYYSESAFDDNQPIPNGDLFYSMNYNQNLTVSGYGANLKVGAIYRPIAELRLGVAAHTPTFYSLSEKYSSTMNSDFFYGKTSAESPINTYDYSIESPFKLIGSAAYTFGTKGLISFDYEYIDYTTMRFSKGGDGYKFIPENQTIKENFTNTFNLKAGGELWIGSLAIRGGYAYYGSPFKSGLELTSTHTNVFSGGFGVKIDNLYLDWAYQRVEFSDKYAPYLIAPVVDRSVAQNRFMLTLGYKF
jgi:hypothetical protein